MLRSKRILSTDFQNNKIIETPMMLITHRNLAFVNGICTAGQYSGTIVFGPVLQLVVEQKGLSGTFVILAGIASIMAPVALVFRQPPQPPGGNSPAIKPRVKAKDVFDLPLLKDKLFVIFLLGISLYAIGAFVPASHAVSMFSLFVPNRRSSLSTSPSAAVSPSTRPQSSSSLLSSSSSSSSSVSFIFPLKHRSVVLLPPSFSFLSRDYPFL